MKATQYRRGSVNSSPDIVTTTYTDAMGNEVKTGRVIGGVERIDTHTFDHLGNKLTTLTALDATRNITYSGKWEYDYAGRVVREYQALPAGGVEVFSTSVYDALGNLVSITDFQGAESKKTYDILGRVTREENPVEAGHYAVTHHEYDPNGNEILTRVQCNKPGEAAQYRRTGFVYDSRNRLTDTIQYLADNDSSYTRARSVYDGVGNVREQYSGMTGTATTGAAKVSYTYNQFQEVLTETDPLGRVIRYTYDILGRLTGKADRDGLTFVYEYNDLDRLKKESSFEGATLIGVKQFSYTPHQTIWQVSNHIMLEVYQYDEVGRLIYTYDTDGISRRMAYDIGDNRTQMIVYDENVEAMRMNYTYDHMNRMQTVSRGGALLATYGYDNNSNRTSLTVSPTGCVTTYGYNLCNQVTSLVNRKADGTVLSQYGYTYYLDGNQASKVEPGKTTSYTYDRLGRLTDEQVSDGNRWSYTFDAFGNRKTLTFTGAAPYAVTYHYNLCNQLISEVRTGTGADTKTYTYDNNGNQTTCVGTAGPLEYRWYNGFDQLVDMSIITAREKYLYRPDDTRHSRASNSDEGYSEVYHVWDQGSIVVDFTFGAGPYTTTLYQRGTGLLAREVSGVRQYYLHNGHGDVVQMVDGAGNVAVRYDYDAFGNLAAPVTGDANPFRYCGEYFDKGSETYYLRARYYNPRIGRFTSEDVAKDGINWYTYCGNNPIANYDPSGMWTFAIGEGWNYTMGTGSSSSMQFSFDTHGYYAIHEAQTNKADQNHMGLCDVGLTPFVQITWLDGVRDLEKDIVNYGISGGFFEYAGLDVLFLDGKPIGVQVAAGPGMGVDAHVMQSDTYAHDFGHVTEIPDKIAEIPDKMAQGLGDILWSWFEFGTGETYSQFKWR